MQKGRFSMKKAIVLILALVMGGLIGMERGRHGRAAGMRTHILVCLGSAITAIAHAASATNWLPMALHRDRRPSSSADSTTQNE